MHHQDPDSVVRARWDEHLDRGVLVAQAGSGPLGKLWGAEWGW